MNLPIKSTLVTLAIVAIANIALSQSDTGKLKGKVTDEAGYAPTMPSSDFRQTVHFVYEEQKKDTGHIAVAESTSVVIEYLTLDIIAVNAFHKGAALRVYPVSSGAREKIFAKYSVIGHPRGPFTITFTDIGDDDTTRQHYRKNRRVEMEVVFE